MGKTTLMLEIDNDELVLIKRRAKKEYLSATELIRDIVRRSMITYKRKGSAIPKVDDPIVGIISRERRGRKRKER